MNNPYSTYKKQSITTLTPVEIVVKLYSETERQLNRAVFFIDQKNYHDANLALTKAQDCINALRSVLDMDIPVSKNLDALYEYFNREIIAANVKKDTAKIKAIIPQIDDLRDAFAQVSAMPKSEIASQNENHSA